MIFSILKIKVRPITMKSYESWGDSRCEFESTGFSSQIAVTKKKKLESKHHVNKQKLSVTSSVNQMVIR